MSVMEANRTLEEATRRLAKVPAINTDSPLAIKCPAGIINWAKEEREAVGMETRKPLPMSKPNTLRLHTRQKLGGG